MAKIWFVREGENPTVGWPEVKPLDWCILHLGLSPSDWIRPLDSPPRFGQPTRLNSYASPRYVVIEVAEEDLPKPTAGWRAGFYLARLSVQQAQEKLKVK